MTNYITVMMIYLYKMAHSTFIVNDIFPPWWDFAMVGICWETKMINHGLHDPCRITINQ